MNRFTFAIITYNQERMVLEQLESIKYQILNYGKNYAVDLLICDDSSKDRTVDCCNRWVDKNRSLFSSVRIFHHEENLGTVANYVFALKKIKTPSFKLLAGDDLYSFRNVFEFEKKCGLLLTPTIKFNGERILHEEIWFFYKELLCTPENKWKKLIRNRIKFQMPIETPGLFFSPDLITEGLFQTLSEYKWIEDVPELNYFINQEATKVFFSMYPLVIYRTNAGISLNKKHERYTVFENELVKITKEIMVRKTSLPKYLNIFTYIYWLRRKVLFALNNTKLDEFATVIEQEAHLANAHVRKIAESASAFFEEAYN